MNTVSDRINQIIRDKNINKTKLSEIAGVSNQAVTNWGKRNQISIEAATKLCKELNLSLDWLLTGNSELEPSKNVIENKKDSFFVEVLDVTASAEGGYVNSDLQEVIKLIEYDAEQAKILFNGLMSSNLKVINIKGDSMQGTFESGDALYIDVSVQFFEGDGIYVFTFGQNLYVKRLQVIKDIIRVKSDNKFYDPWEIKNNEIDQLYIHGKVMLSQSMLLRKHG